MALSGTFTPYSTVSPLIQSAPTWVPEADRDRIASYTTYDEIYWSNPQVFRLQQRGDEFAPIYIPNAMTVCNTTSHYLLKGLRIIIGDPDSTQQENDALRSFLRREKFMSQFHIAKQSGVVRGDFIFHITADDTKDAGERISINSVYPGQWFPVRDPDDATKIIKVHLATTVTVENQMRVKRLTYTVESIAGARRIGVEEGIWKTENWWDDAKGERISESFAPYLLPSEITQIPVYQFQNIGWQSLSFGSSELRGFERLLGAVNQAISDEEMALALDGLGVYATDAGRPVDDEGNEVDWEVGPAKVMEVPNGNYFRRVEGLGSVTPSQDHIAYLESKLHEASGTSDVALGQIDVQTASSGIALAIKFMPTLAKLEQRDMSGIDTLNVMFHDWQMWMAAFEDDSEADKEINAVIGDKLPADRTAKINELNNMLDRSVISIQYYRQEMQALGYKFPADMQTQIENEKKAAQALIAVPNPNQDGQGDGGNTLPPPSNKSNNRNKPNESGGTEANQPPSRQARGARR